MASVMGVTPKDVNFAMAFVKFPLARAPMILEAFPAGDSNCGRLRLPSRSSTSSNSGHSPCRNFWKRCIVYASLLLALREGCSCASGGGGARSTHPGSRSRSFSARFRVVQSPVCWAVLIMGSRSMRITHSLSHSHTLTFSPSHLLTFSLTHSVPNRCKFSFAFLVHRIASFDLWWCSCHKLGPCL